MEANRRAKSGGKGGILLLVALAIVLSGANANIKAGPRYKTIDLGTLGGNQSWASGINNLGQVVGTSRTASGDYHAFIWQDTNGNGESDPGEMQDLGTLGGSGSVATGINNIGQVVGSSTTGAHKYHAFLWDSNSGMIDLGTLNENRFSYGTGINDSGQVVGYSADSTEPDVDNVAFLWDSVNGMVEFLPSSPFPEPYATTSKATGINNSGQVVGTLRTYYDWWGELITVTSAFLWDSNDVCMLLGSLGGDRYDSSSANAINNIGQVAGGSHTNEFFIYHAFLWDENGGMIDLGTLGEMQSSVGYGINDAGCVVGRCRSNGPEEAFMWDSVNGMTCLSYQLPGYSEWQNLRRAYGVNNLGQVVGSGLTKSQQEHAFVMTPLAEPSTTHLVPTEYPTIQAAINAAWAGDKIIVAPGTYSGSGNRDLDFKGKVITVQSTDPNDAAVVAATVIDCNGSFGEAHRGFYFHSGEDANSVVEGVKIVNGYSHEGGGGIYCKGSSPTISKCIISNNDSGYAGGGIYCFDSSPAISGCNVSDNGGGGIWCHGESRTHITGCTISGNNGSGILSGWDANTTITNCTITGNTTIGGGGGILCADATITNCVITGNSAEAEHYTGGGGIFCLDNSNQVISNCIITDNRSSKYGGGICGYWDGTELVITNCIIAGNVAGTGKHGGNGGGVAFCDGPIRNCIITGNRAEDGGGVASCGGIITNCLIAQNRAEGAGYYEGLGGGLYMYDGAVVNCTIVDNRSGRAGGGMSYCSGSVTNCIVRDNRAGQIHESGVVMYSNVEGGFEGEGNIDAEPEFALVGDYHIMPGSACIDAGTNDPCGGLAGTDLEGVARPLDGDGDGNSVADMGVYEFSLENSTIAALPLSFWFVQDWTEREPQTLSIRNSGGVELNWEVVEDCNWLEVTPTNGVSIGEVDEVTITVDPNGLAPGFYTYAFSIEDPNASNSPVEVVVAMPVGELLCVRSGEYPTIQSAIDAASNYDVVVVADGNYTGEGNRSLDFGGKAITVKSENGPANCVIDCENSGNGFNFESGEEADSIVAGFTIASGGQGIWCREGSPTIKNCSVIDNSEGGIVSSGTSSPRIIGCRISGNTGDEPEIAGGITYGYRGPFGSSTAEVVDCVVSNNIGAGIICGQMTIATIENCTVRGNSSEHYGSGGIVGGGEMTINRCVVVDNYRGIACYGTTTIVDCTIRNNNAVYDEGGGVYCGRGKLTIRDCMITNNVGWREGGGVYCEECSVAITNSTITGNFAKGGKYNYGGGICCGDDADLAVRNCTVTGNFVDRGGGGICCFGRGACEVSNCVLWGNEASEGPEIYLRNEGVVFVSYSDVEGGQDGVYIDSYSVLDWGAGNIDEDPVFVKPGEGYLDDNGTPDDSRDDSYFWVEGDYHLLGGSPCIDAGDPNYFAGPGETDLDGKPRVADGDGDGEALVDMGAYESELPAIEVEVKITPQTLNCESEGRWVKAHIVLPEGYWPEDIDVNTPAVIEPTGAESEYIKVFDKGRGRFGVEIGFEREAFCAMEPEGEDGYLDVKVTGWLLTGQRFEGTDTIKIINQHWRHRHEKRFRERPAKRMIGNQQGPAAGRSQATRE